MFSYFILRIEKQSFCYLYGGMLALFLILLSPFFFTGGGLLLVMLSVALFWGGLALYTRHTDRMRKPDVSPLVSVRDGIQVVPEPPDDDGVSLDIENYCTSRLFFDLSTLAGLSRRNLSEAGTGQSD